MHHYSDNCKNQHLSTFRNILLWPVQILSWMWHDIKPGGLKRESITQALYVFLAVIVVVRFIILWQTSGSPDTDQFYTLRHFIYTLVWATLMYFFFNLYMIRKSPNPLIQNLKEMERASLFAFIACIVKFVTSACYTFVYRISTMTINIVTAYYIGELLIWAMLSVFLYFFWRDSIKISNRARKDEYGK